MKFKKDPKINTGFILFSLFLIFTFFTLLNLTSQVDYKITIFLQGIIPDFLTTSFSTFSVLGTAEVLTLILFLSLLIFTNIKRIYVVVLYAFVTLIELTGKLFIEHQPPPIEFLKTNISIGFPSGAVAPHLYSYPSGHSARTAFVSGFIILMIWLNPKLSKETKIAIITCILIFDSVMFVSRVYLGEHWASDVVGGALLGFSLAFFTSYFLTKKSAKK